MKITKYLKDLFAAPSSEVIALKELEAAKCCLLEAHTGREFAASMVSYHEARIRRLTTYLHEQRRVKCIALTAVM